MITSTIDSAISENSIAVSVKNKIFFNLSGEMIVFNMNTGTYYALN